MDLDAKELLPLNSSDHFTGLPNSIFFNEVLNKALSYAKRRHKVLAVLVIEFAHAKSNESGDVQSMDNLLLKPLAKSLANTLRIEDLLATLEGNKFVVLLNDIAKPKFASTVAEKILRNITQNINIDVAEIPITANIGIGIYPSDGDSVEDLLNKADEALTRAKRTGKGVYKFHTEDMDFEAREFIQMGNALAKAIANNELVLYYQPKLHLKQGKVTSLEALVRWEHPQMGIISPEKFIPVAEETGLIMGIGEWILRKACQTNRHWQEEGYEHLTISVNLSPVQFNHPDIASIIAALLKETGLKPSYLELEINEKTVMEDIEVAAHILDKIKATGVKISIDHFGAGYTSISHLKKFPLSLIKIDPLFIKGTPYIPNDTAITSAFIGLAHSLGFEVVAEGVETTEQMEYLSSQGCDMIQGYFLSAPLPAEQVIQQFKKIGDEVF